MLFILFFSIASIIPRNKRWLYEINKIIGYNYNIQNKVRILGTIYSRSFLHTSINWLSSTRYIIHIHIHIIDIILLIIFKCKFDYIFVVHEIWVAEYWSWKGLIWNCEIDTHKRCSMLILHLYSLYYIHLLVFVHLFCCISLLTFNWDIHKFGKLIIFLTTYLQINPQL